MFQRVNRAQSVLGSGNGVSSRPVLLPSQEINLSIPSNYAPSWGPMQAFRELVQNWRAAIIQSFDLEPRGFRVKRDEAFSNDLSVITFTATMAGEDKPLGYIRFRSIDGLGTIEMVNRNATIERDHLNIGSTTRRGSDNQAATHGEGLKIALLVLQRQPQNHSVRLVTKSTDWQFDFTPESKLVARQAHFSPQQPGGFMTEDRTHPRPFLANPASDVVFILGEERMGIDDCGQRRKRSPIQSLDFEKWCTCAIFLQDIPNGNVYTSAGTLITNQDFSGRLYLNGMLLQGSSTQTASVTGLPLQYSYDFENGEVNRERQSLASIDAEGLSIMEIWKMALMVNPELISKLHDMLMRSRRSTLPPRNADVALEHQHWKREIVIQLKAHLLKSEKTWYFSGSQLSRNPSLRSKIEGLGYTGKCLPWHYWQILQTHKIFRTVSDEEGQIFVANSREVSEFDGKYAQELVYLMRFCFSACTLSGIPHMDTHFVQVGGLCLEAYVWQGFEGLFFCKINARFLNKRKSLEWLGLPKTLDDLAAASYVAKSLFREIYSKCAQLESQRQLEQNPLCMQMDKAIQDFAEIKNAITISGHWTETPGITIAQPPGAGWLDDPFSGGMETEVHGEASCGELRGLLLSDPSLVRRSGKSCSATSCRVGHMMQGAKELTISGLESGKKYFCVVKKLVQTGIVTPIPIITDYHIVESQESQAEAPASYSKKILHGPQSEYEAKNPKRESAVIGIPKAEEASTSAKRPRL
ncbi:hypothetical protein B0I35DRAFT_513963 [Stachybotrys elegans]|uniref:Uncharacterized protein n=1 Tax=Stachybotrys elegans TaxID=80388 RepID=A0A8K0SNN2_9HYPO|nr:hypothetical protein B0I35DRAFT_513963 [Stachybotrys elegans]